MTADEVVRAARVRTNSKFPYLQSALWTMRLEPDDRCPTMGVSESWVCYYNPTLVATWSVEATSTVLLHELWHLLRNHADRAKKAGVTAINHRAWNIAADAEINDGLIQAKLPFPTGIEPVTPSSLSQPDDLLAEEYYARLPRSKSNQAGVGVGGSGADGVNRPWEAGGEKPGEKGKSGNEASARAVAGDLIRKQVAEAIGRHAGNVPGAFKRWAGDTLKPHFVPWQQIFRSVMGTIISAGRREEYTYARPARREHTGEYILPGSYGSLPDVVVLADTSGSMGEADLQESISILESILEYLGRTYPITVIAGDCEVQAVSKTLSGRNVDLSGGGGTDMGALLAHAEGLRPRAQIAVVVTDGYTPWPATMPSFSQVVVVLTQATREHVPAWATIVPAYVKE